MSYSFAVTWSRFAAKQLAFCFTALRNRFPSCAVTLATLLIGNWLLPIRWFLFLKYSKAKMFAGKQFKKPAPLACWGWPGLFMYWLMFLRYTVLRQNPSAHWVILIFSGQKPCTFFLHFSRAIADHCWFSVSHHSRSKSKSKPFNR